MKPINFAGYVRVNNHYINAQKVVFINTPYNPSDEYSTPLLVYLQNGRNIELKNTIDAQKLTNLFIKAQNTDAVLDYEA